MQDLHVVPKNIRNGQIGLLGCRHGHKPKPQEIWTLRLPQSFGTVLVVCSKHWAIPVPSQPQIGTNARSATNRHAKRWDTFFRYAKSAALAGKKCGSENQTFLYNSVSN